MMPDRSTRPADLLLLGLAHPVTYALAGYLRGILAVCDPPVGCTLVTDDSDISSCTTVLYLRPDATGTLGLAASLRDDADADALAGHALAARMDDRWRDLPRLSPERVLACCGHAVETLSSCLDIPMTAPMLAAAGRHLEALRGAVAAFDHPLAFWDAFGADETDTDAGAVMPDGSVWLNGIDGSPDMPERVRACAAFDGPLAGREGSQAAAARVAAQVAASDARWAARVFVLAGADWAALPVARP